MPNCHLADDPFRSADGPKAEVRLTAGALHLSDYAQGSPSPDSGSREAETVDQQMAENDDAPPPPMPGVEERPADRSRLHWQSRQDSDFGNRDGGDRNAGVQCVALVV